MTTLLSIGDLSHASGLPVSALRYYDTHDVLVPAVVDDRTGYRRYTPDQLVQARFVAGLRSIAVPVAEMPAILERLDDREQVAGILEAHVDRLQDEADAARQRVQELLALLDTPVVTHELTFPLAAFRAALATVGYAVGERRRDLALDGIHLVASDGICTWAATDEHRYATTTTPVSQGIWSGTVAREVLERLLDDAASNGTAVTLPADVETLPGAFPDPGVLRPYLGRGAITVLSTEQLRGDLRPADDGTVQLLGLTLNRRYLDEALGALGGEDVLVEADGELAPLALRHPHDGSTWALLKPIRTSA